MPNAKPRRARGRPEMSPEDRAAMRRRIEVCASELFHRDGYPAVSMRKIASALSCSTNTLYAYFDSKMEILASIWIEVFDDIFATVGAAVAAAATPEARARAFCRTYVDHWIAHPDQFDLVFMAMGLSQADVRSFVEDPRLLRGFAMLDDALCAHLGRALDDPQVWARRHYLITSIHGTVFCLVSMRGYDWPDAHTLVDLAVDGALAPLPAA